MATKCTKNLVQITLILYFLKIFFYLSGPTLNVLEAFLFVVRYSSLE